MISNKGRILLVDDEPLVLEILELALREEGYDVLTAPEANTALHFLERTHFDAFVCDVRLDDLDGFDLLSIARRKNNSIAAVLITGAPSEEDASRAHALRAFYLSKPISVRMLLNTIELSMQLVRYESDEQLQEA